MQIKQEKGHYTLYKESEAIGTAVVDGAAILRLEIVPAWRGRGYGSYLVKELLRRGGGLDPTVYAGCENAVGVYGAAGRMQVITVGPVTQGDADAVLEVCRARGLVDAGLYRSEWRDA